MECGEYTIRCENINDKEEKNTTINETSFAQSNTPNCYCCGKAGHKISNCPEKDTHPRKKWASKHPEQYLQAEESQKNDESVESNATSTSSCSNRARNGFQINLMNDSMLEYEKSDHFGEWIHIEPIL